MFLKEERVLQVESHQGRKKKKRIRIVTWGSSVTVSSSLR